MSRLLRHYIWCSFLGKNSWLKSVGAHGGVTRASCVLPTSGLDSDMRFILVQKGTGNQTEPTRVKLNHLKHWSLESSQVFHNI
ncbi:unnamed protein product [Clavelina lepadiformis]|uniref:Uncharacterized protein n=1 Tax=Clavelina lepadiformis TaxID=159417 RepID=A0ABP0F446_CLALP